MKKQRLLDEDDPYSHLGENLWSSILSLLPVHEAVRTSILSRTWRNAWMQIPHLNICFITMCEQLEWNYNNDSGKWIQVVGKILMSHNGPIQSCVIDTCGSNANHACIDGWISTLIEKSISELTLKVDDSHPSYKSKNSYRVPHFLFSCKSLHSLRLSGCFLRAQNHMSFSCNELRKMILLYNQIDVEFIHALLHQCSSLQKLRLKKCHLNGCDKDSILSINAANLKTLVLLESYDMRKNVPWKLIRINAPHLERLDLVMLNFKESHIVTPELVTFNSWMRGFYDGWINLRYEARKMEAILKSIAHVEHFSLKLSSDECLSAGSFQIPTFMNLRRVFMALDLTQERVVKFFSSMLGRCPYLAELVLRGRGDYRIENKLLGLDYWEKQDQFNCFEHTLTSVAIKWKTKYEIEFAKYVLAKAKVLRHLTITRTSSMPSMPSEEVLAPLPLVERASRVAKLTLEH